MKIERHFAIMLTYLRTLIDMFFLVHIATRFFTAYIDPASVVLGRGELVTDPERIAYRYIRSNFLIDLAAALPVPQILVWAILPSLRLRHIDTSLSVDIINSVGFLAKNGWNGSIYNLFLYLIASHVVGSIYYLLAVGRQKTCWETQCSIEGQMADKIPCDFKFLDCIYATSNQTQVWAKSTEVFAKCDVNSNGINYGIFIQAMKNGVAAISFPEKYFFSLWWGLQQLTTYGNPLVTSSYIGENLFAIGLTLLSIGLFPQLIGGMMFLEYKWIETQGVEGDAILKQLPVDLRRDIKLWLCLDLVQRVPLFSAMDHQLLDAICERMNYFLCTEGTYIIREGDPLKVMTFIFRGQLESCTTDGGRVDFFNSIILKPGDFCGEELLTWALLPSSVDRYPLSTRTVRTITEFEGFSLQADDLKFVASTYRMMHSKCLQHIFQFHSHQWRAWAARFIQSAWRRHKSQETAERGLSTSSSVSQAAEFPFSKIATILKAQNGRPEEPDFFVVDHLN
ncbi:hypothetical protein HU200_061379 [Digitaria exilis]|uniref:Cyclic nucleotide-binding domain-containing protein n=1 Tax=Digitaria exilis TaxID=1010633 RepID=A0A835ACQ5_9POAL|nr:hypothetical protein HU200_061379 [Digitaria exilis]